MPAKKLLIILFATLGLGMTIVAYIWYSNTTEFLNRASLTQGTVVELQRVQSNNTTTYKPVVSFRTETGAQIRFTSSFASNPSAYHQGEKVSVVYLESEPEKAKISTFYSLWAGASILAIVGSIFLLLAGAILLMSGPKRT